MKKIILVLLIGILGLSCEKKKDDNLAPLAALALGSSSPTTGATITRDWGTFTDMGDGTVKLVVTAGTFGGQTYTAQTLFYAKCTHGQTYDAAGNTCTGSASLVKYCNVNDNSCNGGTNSGTLNGSGTSTAYTACNGLSLASKTWRVPSKNELKLLLECNNTTIPNDGADCGGSPSPAINTFFPNTLTLYRSSTSNNASSAWFIDFSNSFVQFGATKTADSYVRCVSGAL